MKNIFKHSGEYVVHSHDKKDYLKKESVEYNSVVDIQENVVLTKSKIKGKIYKFSFKVPMGLSPEIDAENKRQLTQLLSSCHGKLKFWLLNEQKNMLSRNMELLKKRVNELQEDSTLSEVCVNRYMIMQTMEKVSYCTAYIFVEDSIYKFEELASTFFNIYNLQGETLLNFLERINNDPLRGDSIVFE